jgi:N-acetylneuraminic acid mutarotase
MVLAVLLTACGAGGSGQTTATTGHPGTSTAATTTPPSSGGGTVSASTAAWKLTEPVAREAVVAAGNNLEILGGLDHTKFSTAAVVVIDPTTGSAQTPAKLAEAVHDSAGAALDGRVLVFGGGGPSENGTADVQAVPASGTATIAGKLPQSRSDHVAATAGNRAYVFSGYDGSAFVPSVLSTADGISFTNLPVPVRYAAIAASSKTLYLFGGVADAAGHDTNAIQALDTATGAITQVAQLPTPVSHASAISLGGKIYVLGGFVNNSTLSDQILRFDPTTKTTTAVGKLPYPVSDAAAITINGKGYLVGGESTQRNPLTSIIVLTGG